MNAILQVENLTKQYADFKLDHVSFSVPKGMVLCQDLVQVKMRNFFPF